MKWWIRRFGNVPEANRVITYAASCGSTSYKDLPEKVAKRISEAFKGVASFSTRDQNTHDFVASLTDADIEDNLDPVLIYNFDDELEDVEMPRVPEHYCVIYSYYNRIHTREEIREMIDWWVGTVILTFFPILTSIIINICRK